MSSADEPPILAVPTAGPPGVDEPPWTLRRPGGEAEGGRRPRSVVLAAGGFLLVAAAVLQLLALVPPQAPGVVSLGHLASTVAPQIVLAAGLVLAAALVAVPGRRAAPAGTAIAVGLVLADLGLVVAAAGEILATDSAGSGLWLLLAAEAVGVVGTLLAVLGQRDGTHGRAALPARRDNALLTVFTVVVGAVLAVALLPAWDRYHEVTIDGSANLFLSYAFAAHTPGAVAAGNLLAAIAFFAVPVVAMLWRPGRVAVLACVGVVIVVAGQAVSAVLQLSETSLSEFATPARARSFHLTVTPSLTGWYDAEVVAGVALLLLVFARWWTPAGGSLLDSYHFDHGRSTGSVSGPSPWGPPVAGGTASGGDRIGFAGHVPHGGHQPHGGAAPPQWDPPSQWNPPPSGGPASGGPPSDGQASGGPPSGGQASGGPPSGSTARWP